ncbi:hypothetical protein GLOIN_2v1473716 [Rhizophagus irregularis DAOM 181602=DAOM 197198]|nr:hypothetical protein GLOIN_2v1473716 [Rhizophagus irregularis DAOM 181602=DAOM 197198]
MATQFFSQLSQNFTEILDDDEYYDVTIEVGQDPKNSDGVLTHIKLPNIFPDIFQIILKYMYGGILSFDEIELSDIIHLLVAAENLKLQEIVNYLQLYLIENKSSWMEENFTFIHNTSFQHDSFTELQKFCTDIMTNYPEKIFNSLDFTSIPEKSLISLIEQDYLKMEEIDVWDHVLKWGLAQNSSLLPDPEEWSDDDFKLMEKSLQKCLPLVRFFQLSSKEFLNKVVPYQKLLNPKLYKDLMSYHLDGDNKIISTIQPARGFNIDSKLITNKAALYIASWIDKKENEHPIYGFTPYNSFDNPYEFKLLLRGSRDGFSPDSFHRLCDNKPKTISIVKVKETEEILGGYNPLIWESCNHKFSQTNDSFTFSFTSTNLLKDTILSRVKNSDYAIASNKESCLCFFNNLIVTGSKGYCSRLNYEKVIRSEEGDFDLEDYEVFQIVKR